MRKLFAVALILTLSPPASNATEYCLYIRTKVTKELRVHTCRDFKTLKECEEAAKKIDGVCKYPPKK
jgi:hypothetical protein